MLKIQERRDELGCELWQDKGMIIQILSQQSLYSRILDAGKDFSSWQCFHVEGFGKIPIFPSPDSRAPTGLCCGCGSQRELGDSGAMDKRGIFWKNILFKIKFPPKYHSSFEASLASFIGCVRHIRIFQLQICPWQWDHSGSTLENILDFLFSLFLTGIPATSIGGLFSVLAQPRISSRGAARGIFHGHIPWFPPWVSAEAPWGRGCWVFSVDKGELRERDQNNSCAPSPWKQRIHRWPMETNWIPAGAALGWLWGSSV